MSNNLHQPHIRATAGQSLSEADAAVIMIHGRGDSAPGILGLAPAIGNPRISYVAPEATGNTWYPHSFLAPLTDNEPWLSSALDTIQQVLDQVQGAGIPTERTVLLGFSQGACLTAEFAARNPQRYGGLAILSGGLIGPDGTDRNYAGSLQGTPVFLGCSDVDFHIPVGRVHESAEVLQGMGGEVTKRIYPNFAHAVNQDEIDFVSGMINGLTGADA